MIKPTMTAAINKQITAEFYAAYLYLSASSFLEKKSYPGMARWMRAQYEEELTHALRLVDFMYDRDGTVTLGAIKQPPAEFGSPLGVYEAALEHEQLVTGMIDDLYALATQERDFASQVCLEWFVTEQVEEEKNVTEVIDQLRLVGDDGPGLLMLDRELGQRPATSITVAADGGGAEAGE